MLLTIGMIVKNEEKYLERCLNGIKPILDNVNSELIITDTGSTDRTVEIAGKFTDKILHFEWIKDFSAARNTVFDITQGEWFMFLDADDIFENCDGIINFFNSGEYKRYNSATYTSHNLTGNGSTFVDYRAPRLTKLMPYTRFEGIIHEHLNTFGEPIRNIYDCAVHYGYLHETEESRRRKFERDAELLLKTLDETGDDNPLIYAELAECFMSYDRNRAFKYIDKGIKVCKENNHFLITIMYSHKAYALYTEGNYEKALNICHEYFEINKKMKLGVTAVDSEIYAIKASSLYNIGRYKEAYLAYKYFFVVFTEIRSGKIHTSDMYAAQFYMATDFNYIRFMCCFLRCGIIISENEDALTFVLKYPSNGYPYKNSEISELTDLEAELILKTNKTYIEKCSYGLDKTGKKMLKDKIIAYDKKKNNKIFKLTIGMIVKNEEKYLEQCLNGIKPILDNVDSELIITDTGSTDRTVEIAGKFTDKILHFEWIKDFSAARNTAFDLASGEWFMFLDADEIFESCNGITDFFNSGEYKKYKSASFVIRNLYNEKEYIDFYPRRMARRYPDTKFIGMIHEYLYPILTPSKHINDVALHYGYLYQTLEETKAKFERNVELMLKTLETEENPHPKIYSQLFDGYGSVFDFENAYKYLEMGIEKCRKSNNDYIVILFAEKAEQLYRSGKYSETYNVCEDYFSEKKRMKLPELTTDGDMYAYEADSLFALERCEEAVEFYKNYFDTYKKIKSGKLCTEDMHQKTIEMCSDRVVPGIFNNFTACCINSGKFNTADMYFTSYPLREYSFDEKALVTLCSRMITVLEKLEYKSISKYVIQLDEKGRALLADMLFIRMYISGGNLVIYNALKKTVSAEEISRVENFLNYFKGEYSENILQNAILQITKCGIQSNELCRINSGKLFVIEPGRCIEDIAAIGRIIAEQASSDSSKELIAAVILDDCIALKNKGQIKLCINRMKDAVKEYQPLASLVSEYCNMLVESLQKADHVSEMDKLAAAVKNNIINMIKNGKNEDAEKTLEQYKTINPADTDIASLEKMIAEGYQ